MLSFTNSCGIGRKKYWNHVLKIPNWLDDLSLIGQWHRIKITQINTGGHHCITWNIFDYILKMKIWIVVNFLLLTVWKNCMKSSAWNILISLSTRGVAKSGKFYVVNSFEHTCTHFSNQSLWVIFVFSVCISVLSVCLSLSICLCMSIFCLCNCGLGFPWHVWILDSCRSVCVCYCHQSKRNSARQETKSDLSKVSEAVPINTLYSLML